MAETLKFGGYQGENSVHTRGGRVLCRGRGCAIAYRDAVVLEFDENIVARKARKAADLLTMTESRRSRWLLLLLQLPRQAGSRSSGLFDQHFVVPDRRAGLCGAGWRAGRAAKGRRRGQTRPAIAVLGYWGQWPEAHLRHPWPDTHVRPTVPRLEAAHSGQPDDHQRVFQCAGLRAAWRSMCATCPRRLRTGQVDAQENPLTNIYNFGLHKTHRHITLTRHLLGVALVLVQQGACRHLAGASPVQVWKLALSEATAAQRRFAEEDDSHLRREAARRRGGADRTQTMSSVRPSSQQQRNEVAANAQHAFSAELVDSVRSANWPKLSGVAG